MLIYSQSRKKIADCAAISVERNVGGGKEGKFALVGSAGFGTMCDGILAVYPDEKTAVDELEKYLPLSKAAQALIVYEERYG